MKKTLIILFIINFLLSSCGTIGGALNGAGSVLEGVASDVRQLGGIFE